jgi:hypothetical protein
VVQTSLRVISSHRNLSVSEFAAQMNRFLYRGELAVTFRGASSSVNGALVSTNWFGTLGVGPAIGRFSEGSSPASPTTTCRSGGVRIRSEPAGRTKRDTPRQARWLTQSPLPA